MASDSKDRDGQPPQGKHEFRITPTDVQPDTRDRWDWVPIPKDLVKAAELIIKSAADPTHAGLTTDGHLIEDIKVVRLSVGGGKHEPGIRMTWRQGDDHYGLLIPVRELISGAGLVVEAGFDLRLAVDEPHESPPAGVVLWFQHLP